jgi:anaerobic magnesium-protoporphyrin IX monomethyl ester cyclase
MSDVVVTHPGAQHGIYGTLADEFTAIEPPTWSRMISGWLRDHGTTASVIDQEALNLSAHQVALQVEGLSPKLVVIAAYGHQPSSSTQQMVAAGEIARAVKALNPDRPIIMAGNHASALPVRTLEEEAVDYVCDGEGPLTIQGLLNDDAPEKIPGLVWRDTDRAIRSNAPAPLIPIDELHGDIWTDLPMGAYRAHSWQCLDDLSMRKPYASIYTTLGCPHSCQFCMINTFQHSNTYRMRTPEKIIDEIEYLHKEFNVSTIKIADEMFVLAPRHYLAICDGLAARGLGKNLNIWSYARVDSVRPDNLARLRDGGIRWLALGIESASKYVRDGAQKRLKNDDIVGVVRAIQDAGIHVIGNFIVGLRDDSWETMQQTFDLAIECMPDWSNWYSAMAYPGSALYDQALKEGWRLPPDWRSFSQHNDSCFPLDTEHVDNRTVLAFRDQAFNDFFSHPAYLAHVQSKFGSDAVAHVKRMMTYKLKRKLLGDDA